MSELYLVRHGQASFGSANYDQLSPLGEAQSQLLGEHFKARGIHFDRVITGDMVRHQQTLAGIQLGSGQQQPAECNSSWNEFDFERLVRAYLQQNPDQQPPADAPRRIFYGLLKLSLLAWAAGDLDHHDLPEHWIDFEQRVRAGLADLQHHTGKERILVVSSGGAIAMAIRHTLQAPSAAMVSLNLQTINTGISRCYFNADGFHMHSFNNVPHLEQPVHADKITFS